MTMLERIISDLRERRLWPVAVVLCVAIVAVPFVLAKTPPRPPPAPAPVASAGTALPASLPSVSVRSGTRAPRAALSAPRPVHQPAQPRTPSVTSISARRQAWDGTSAAPTSPGGRTISGRREPRRASGGGRPPAATTAHPSPSRRFPRERQAGAVGPRSKQTYDVTLASTAADGGLTRSLRSSASAPSRARASRCWWSSECSQGGQRVLFAVLPGTTAPGPGSLHSRTDRLRGARRSASIRSRPSPVGAARRPNSPSPRSAVQDHPTRGRGAARPASTSAGGAVAAPARRSDRPVAVLLRPEPRRAGRSAKPVRGRQLMRRALLLWHSWC